MKDHNGRSTVEGVLLFSRSKRYFLLTALAGAMLSAGGCDSGPAIVPKSLNTYADPNKRFSIQVPSEWDSDSGNVDKHGWVKYTSGSAKIVADVCPVKDFIALIAQTGQNPMVDLQTNPSKAASKVHWLENPELQKEEGVKEQRTLPVQTNAGKGSQSEYTTTDDPPLHGYRATVVIGENRIKIYCECPETEWKTLKPVFDKVIASVGP
jgi:hypothetical protein